MAVNLLGSDLPLTDHLVVTYHYIREQNTDGVTGISPAEFDAHVRAIKSRYRIVTADEFVALHDSEKGLALVTFDDAVRDQLTAASILDDHGLPGVFYAPMRPYSDEAQRWCTQHLLHALAEHLGWAEFERRAWPLLEDVAIDRAEVDRLYHYEVPAKRRLKYALAFAVPQARAATLLLELNSAVGLSAADWYMSAAELRSLEERGHALGGHGYDHVPFTTLTSKQQAAELSRSVRTLNTICGARPRTLAYPYGRWNATTAALAAGCGYTFAFTTENRVDAKFVLEKIQSNSARR